ncbi:DNA-directed RNA polymerase subunit [Paragonimus kellicotti]|nr:DNA-directed RNA polymerase subunit [Paragonimus kellicotti]
MRWFTGMEVSFTNQPRYPQHEPTTTEATSDYFKSMLKRAKKILKSEITLKQALESQYTEEPFQDGPSVRKECSYCGNDRMTVHLNLILRSADTPVAMSSSCYFIFSPYHLRAVGGIASLGIR